MSFIASKNRVIQTVLKVKDNFTKPLTTATNKIKKLKTTIQENESAFARAVKKNENKIVNSIKNMKKQFKQMSVDISKSIASISYSGLQKGINILKGFALIGGSLGIASIGAGLFEGMDYEGYRTQLITATKDTEKATKLIQDAILFANKTPFETGEIIEATAKFESMGLSAERWLSITADMAGATSKDMIQAVEAVIDAVASSEFERLKEFGISKRTLEDLDVNGEIFNNQGSVVDQLKLADTLFSAMESRFEGGAEALSKTTRGMWSTVTGVFKNSMAKIVGITDEGTVRTGSLIDYVRKVVERLSTKMVEWQQNGTIEKISAKFDVFVSKLKGAFSYLLKTLEKVKVKFQEWQEDGTIDNIKEKIANVFKNIINFIPIAIKSVFSFIKNLKLIAPVVLGIIAGIKTWGIVSNITSIFTDLLAKKQAFLNIVAKSFNKTAWTNPWVLVIGGIVVALTWLILNFDKVKQFAIKFWEVICDIGSSIVEAFSKSGKAIIEAFSKAGNAIIEAFKGAFKAIGELIKNLFEFIGSIMNNYIEHFTFIIKSVLENLKLIFAGLTDFISGVFTGNWKQALNGLKNIAEGIFNIIKNIFLSPFKFFGKGLNWVIDKVNSISIDIPEWIPIVGGKTFGFKLPKIPDFATGTSYHRGGLARINESNRGEIVDLPNGSKVIPSNKTDKILNNKNNNVTVNINVYNTNNTDKIIDELANKLKLVLNNM